MSIIYFIFTFKNECCAAICFNSYLISSTFFLVIEPGAIGDDLETSTEEPEPIGVVPPKRLLSPAIPSMLDPKTEAGIASCLCCIKFWSSGELGESPAVSKSLSNFLTSAELMARDVPTVYSSSCNLLLM